MNDRLSRRDALKRSGALALVGVRLPTTWFRPATPLRVAGRDVVVEITSASPRTVRVRVLPSAMPASPLPDDGALVRRDWRPPAARLTSVAGEHRVKAGDLSVTVTGEPLAIRVEAPDGRLVQRLAIDDGTGALAFTLGDGPVLGLGEGGPQFDRRGAVDPMRSGQGGYRLRTHGGRVPIPWLIGTSGWAMLIHTPTGAFDLSGPEGKFTPARAIEALPLDVFVVQFREPAEAMAEYARLTGYPEMPPLWAFGYQQSHRTITSPEDILTIARTFREKKLPCDALIYLGTGFAPSGWNVQNGSFAFNPAVFPDPAKLLGEMHAMHYRIVLHAVINARTLRGTVADGCTLSRFDEEQVGCYWNLFRKPMAIGVDAWWPDEGDPLDARSRLTRIRMHWEGPQLDRPNERPYALHRNGHTGMQRYAPFLWSGDVYTTWETLRTHVPIAINTGLSGIPYWGTDTGGFVPTAEFTGELFVRWFQFSAFCPLFRSHGRTWHLRLPWGWNTGELGPNEIANYTGGAANPDPTALHDARVEPICKQYLELRYRMLPYVYSAVWESHTTGLPIMRALWLHYADDATAVARADQYLWGRDLLVAPVTEQGATSKQVYLPRGDWIDFWTEERVAGGREVAKPVDLATIPLYARAGAIIPFGPVRQYTAEKVDGPLTFVVYPGADGRFTYYEDDGISFDYRRGARMMIDARWDDRARALSLRLAPGSRMLASQPRSVELRVAGDRATHPGTFDGGPLVLRA